MLHPITLAGDALKFVPCSVGPLLWSEGRFSFAVSPSHRFGDRAKPLCAPPRVFNHLDLTPALECIPFCVVPSLDTPGRHDGVIGLRAIISEYAVLADADSSSSLLLLLPSPFPPYCFDLTE